MDVRDKIARHICAGSGSSGFCSGFGESVGCRVGRGEAFDGTNCKASCDQLLLSGYTATADAILAIPELATALAPRTNQPILKHNDYMAEWVMEHPPKKRKGER